MLNKPSPNQSGTSAPVHYPFYPIERVQVVPCEPIDRKMEAVESPALPSSRISGVTHIVFGSLFILTGIAWCLLAYLTRIAPNPNPPLMTFLEHLNLRGLLAGLIALGMVFLIVARGFAPRLLQGRWKVAFIILAGTVVIAASFNYFYGARGLTKQHFINFHDMYHYLLGVKYYPEVGYNNYYACHMKADQERSKPRYRNRHRVRDLNDYKMRTAKEIRETAMCNRFSESRWSEFKADTHFFDAHVHNRVTTDRGYNGTPFHAFLAGGLANIPDVNYPNLVRISFVDTLILAVLFGFLTWSFGWKIASLFATFLFVNFCDYYFHVSFSRYWWLLCLGLGLGFLYREKYGPSAVFLVASAMLNVFPILFMAGLGLKMGWGLVKKRTLDTAHKTFLIWAVVASLLFGGISMLHTTPIERYGTFFKNMSFHSSLLTRSRIGFKYNFLSQNKVDQSVTGRGNKKKHAEWKLYKVPYYLLSGLILLFAAMLVLRLDDFRATVLSGFLLFFMLFTTVAYYYACASVLVLLWGRDLHRKINLGFIALLFGLMGLVYVIWWQTESFMLINNTVMTALFTLYLGATMVYLAFETGLLGKQSWIHEKMFPMSQHVRSLF